ncbi:hypothetical protein DRF65_11145 [Chryseobacterium pennae]|uniref:Uncharacterized protein n=1 Tax=Chryseobacterium pennae TaxID=2258962 RepID=A0A3D9C9T3_9FLAO|nr:hypothetical protein [Chryseobacterium pennae]REC62261.1 hypothetical protein DRF65_11145 [Chryseobacterium pennae]
MSFSTVLLTKSDFPNFIDQKTATAKKIYYHRELKGGLAKEKAGDSFEFSILRVQKALLQQGFRQGSKCALPVVGKRIWQFRKKEL